MGHQETRLGELSGLAGLPTGPGAGVHPRASRPRRCNPQPVRRADAVRAGVLGSLLALLLLAPGCTSVVHTFEKASRQPGERLTAFPEEVFDQYECGTRSLPWFAIEENELVPPRLKAGGEFNHRFVYVMCPSKPTEVETGTLSTRILYRGKPILQDRIPDYDLKPGRWVMDAFIELPVDAEAGVYALEIRFNGRRLDFDEQLTFAVDPS